MDGAESTLSGLFMAVRVVEWVFRGVTQVMFVNNPLCGLLIMVGLLLQNPWWALNGLLATLVSTVSAILLGQNREAVSAGLYGYNGTLVGTLTAVFSAKGDWYWWLLLPNMFLAMMCPVVTSALSSVASKWDLPVLSLPFDILVCLHIAATGIDHPYFPQVDIQPSGHLLPTNESFSISQALLSVPVGVGQVYGCDSPWTGGLILLAVALASPTLCFHAVLGSAAGALCGFALAAPYQDIYCGLRGFNSALSCMAVGGVFRALTWQTHLLALLCAFFSAYMTSAIANVMSALALPVCTWPFCLSTLIFLLISSEIPAICRPPPPAVSRPEENRCERRGGESAEPSQQSGSQKEAHLKGSGGPSVQVALEEGRLR